MPIPEQFPIPGQARPVTQLTGTQAVAALVLGWIGVVSLMVILLGLA